MSKTILVTGATGAQGGALVPLLLARGHRVRAMTRNIEKPSARHLASLGAEPVSGNLDDEDSLVRACEGVDAVFAVQNFWERGVGYEREIEQGKKLARAAQKQQIKHFLQTSVAGCDNAPGVLHFESKWVIEQYIDEIGLPRTFLREVFFMENFFEPVMMGGNKQRMSPTLVLAMLSGALGKNTPFHMVTVEDIAWFAAHIFDHPDQWLGKHLDVASDVLTVDEMKAIYRKVTGKRPLPFSLPFWLLRLQNPESARQLRWNNDPGWQFSLAPLRELNPSLTSFEDFLRRRLNKH